MRTTIDIDEKLIKEAQAILHTKTKRELIERSLEEVVRREKLRRLASWAGRIPMISRAEFLRMRRRG